MNFGHRNELRAYELRKLEEDASKGDMIVGVVCLVLFAGLVIAGVI